MSSLVLCKQCQRAKAEFDRVGPLGYKGTILEMPSKEKNHDRSEDDVANSFGGNPPD